jgi:hypothetical protein
MAVVPRFIRQCRHAGDWSVVLPLRQTVLSLQLACGALVAFCGAAPEQAWAEGRLEAHYVASLAGIPIGEGNWVIDIKDARYTAAASGVTTGLMRVFTGGEGTSAVHGVVKDGQVSSATYAATIKTRRETDQTRIVVEHGNVKEFKIDPPPDENPERVPVTERHQKGVLDPMTASLVRVPGTGSPLGPQACERRLSIFDGRLRYDLQFAYKRMDQVKAEKGYAGPVVVCSVRFFPIAGHVPSRRTVKYLTKMRDMEVWLAPIAGTRVLAPFRAQGPTPIGQAKLQADRFVTAAQPSRAAADRPKTQ